MPAIRNCLEHRHSYVRRNAVMAIYTIYRLVTFLIKLVPAVVKGSSVPIIITNNNIIVVSSAGVSLSSSYCIKQTTVLPLKRYDMHWEKVRVNSVL